MASQIRSMQLVLANGSVANFGPGDSRLKGLSVGLGAFGVITQVELNLEPTFNTTNYVYQKYEVILLSFQETTTLTLNFIVEILLYVSH